MIVAPGADKPMNIMRHSYYPSAKYKTATEWAKLHDDSLGVQGLGRHILNNKN